MTNEMMQQAFETAHDECSGKDCRFAEALAYIEPQLKLLASSAWVKTGGNPFTVLMVIAFHLGYRAAQLELQSAKQSNVKVMSKKSAKEN